MFLVTRDKFVAERGGRDFHRLSLFGIGERQCLLPMLGVVDSVELDYHVMFSLLHGDR